MVPDRQETSTRDVLISVPEGALHGDLVTPAGGRGIVVFAHGRGSSRHSRRNGQVASALQSVRIGTLLMDLLTEREEREEQCGAALRFDVSLLAERLGAAHGWLGREPETCELPIAYCGASTGAAAALIAAAERPGLVSAVVSRGGRPDLVSEHLLRRVRSPCLFIVGGDDSEVLELNRRAFAQLDCERSFEVVAGATHLFEEPGALERVAQLACAWFERWFALAGAARGEQREGAR